MIQDSEMQAAQDIIQRALIEDVGSGDATAQLVSIDQNISSEIVAKADGVVSGLALLPLIFDDITFVCEDGDHISRGDILAKIQGPAELLWERERLALNLLQQLSGVATQTHDFVEACWATDAKIYDTRKTWPTLRPLQRYAVRCGGGHNHRYNLEAAVMVKDTHVDAVGMKEIVRRINADRPQVPIMIETRNLEEIKLALTCKPDVILLDNMSLAELTEAVDYIGDTALTEATGNVNLQTVREIAKTGVDRISVGSLTHSVKALDISMYTR